MSLGKAGVDAQLSCKVSLLVLGGSQRANGRAVDVCRAIHDPCVAIPPRAQFRHLANLRGAPQP